MKEHKLDLFIFLTILILFIGISANAEDSRVWVDLPDEITIGVTEVMNPLYCYPSDSGWYGINVSCDNPNVMILGPVTVDNDHYAEGLHYRRRNIAFLEKGTYLLHYSAKDGYNKDVIVHVKDIATSVHVTHDVFYGIVGEKIDLGLTLEGGILYKNPKMSITRSSDDYVLNDNNTTFTALKPGTFEVTMSIDIGISDQYGTRFVGKTLDSFTIYTADICENIHFSLPYDDRAPMASPYLLTVLNGNDEVVHPYIEITEGSEIATLRYSNENTFLRAQAPGWVTIKATGTDGSTDTRRLRVYDLPENIEVHFSSMTIPAGESIIVDATYYPEDTWAPLKMGIFYADHTPLSSGLRGPVAVTKDNVLTGILPGTCKLEVYVGAIHEYYDITVTDSDEALIFERPEPNFCYEKPFQMCVHDRTGKIYAAKYWSGGPYIQVSADGLLTADVESTALIEVTLDNGLKYQYNVHSVRKPEWISLGQTEISIPLNETYTISTMSSDVGDLSVGDWVLCSNDETVIQCDEQTIYPVGIGETTITIWSSYSQASFEVSVIVTKATNTLYFKRDNQLYTSWHIDVPYQGKAILPVLTDYEGNEVSVTWKITEQKNNIVSLSGKTLTGIKVDSSGYAYVTATSRAGGTFKVLVSTYHRSEKYSLSSGEETIRAGDFAQIDLNWDSGSNGAMLSSVDVDFSLSGDTDCVLWDNHFGYQIFYGLKPGVVELKAHFYNGETLHTVITVEENPECREGHLPSWRVELPSTKTRNGVNVKYCSRCGLILGSETIPCSGTLGFIQENFFIEPGESVLLGTHLNGDYKQSFTWSSSNPDIVNVESGRVTGIKEGAAIITVWKGDCTPAECRVHVVNQTDGVTILPDNIHEIEASAFEGTMIKYVVVPSGATIIGSRAFADCMELKMIVLPASMTYIADDAFDDNPQVRFECSIDSYAATYAKEHGIPIIQ